MTKFSALRTLATLLRVVAVLDGLIGTALAIKAASAADGSTLMFLAAESAVAFRVLLTYAFAEAIGVFLAIEENTRLAASAAMRPVPASMAKAPTEEGDEAAGEATDDGSPTPGRTPTTATKKFVTCASCGKRTEADGRFCQKCGKPTLAVDDL